MPAAQGALQVSGILSEWSLCRADMLTTEGISSEGGEEASLRAREVVSEGQEREEPSVKREAEE